MVSHIGGRMYGDGEYVVQFENVGSMQAPLAACVISPNGMYTLSLGQLQRPSVKLAAEIIARVRADEAV